MSCDIGLYGLAVSESVVLLRRVPSPANVGVIALTTPSSRCSGAELRPEHRLPRVQDLRRQPVSRQGRAHCRPRQGRGRPSAGGVEGRGGLGVPAVQATEGGDPGHGREGEERTNRWPTWQIRHRGCECSRNATSLVQPRRIVSVVSKQRYSLFSSERWPLERRLGSVCQWLLLPLDSDHPTCRTRSRILLDEVLLFRSAPRLDA